MKKAEFLACLTTEILERVNSGLYLYKEAIIGFDKSNKSIRFDSNEISIELPAKNVKEGLWKLYSTSYKARAPLCVKNNVFIIYDYLKSLYAKFKVVKSKENYFDFVEEYIRTHLNVRCEDVIYVTDKGFQVDDNTLLIEPFGWEKPVNEFTHEKTQYYKEELIELHQFRQYTYRDMIGKINDRSLLDSTMNELVVMESGTFNQCFSYRANITILAEPERKNGHYTITKQMRYPYHNMITGEILQLSEDMVQASVKQGELITI